MLNKQNDHLLSQLTVRIQNANTSNTIGSGIVFYSKHLKNKVYIITAAHCLYEDGETSQKPLTRVQLDIYNPSKKTYQSIRHVVDFNLVSTDSENDIAVLILERSEVEAITGELPSIKAVKDKQSVSSFVVKGFPNATQGKELVCIHPTWNQSMTVTNSFQLNLVEDYTDYYVEGFSGSGVFLNAQNDIYLLGIFTRFRREEKGKVIYCQYLELANELLARNYLPVITFSFFADFGLNLDFFAKHVETAIANLGPRYNSKLNFKLPIARLFNNLAKDRVFQLRLLKCVDKWLLEHNYYNPNADLLKQIIDEYEALRKDVKYWCNNIAWEPDKKINVQPFINRINTLDGTIENKIYELNDLQYQELGKDKNNPNRYHNPPYGQDISYLRNIRNNNNSFLYDLQKVNVNLANTGCLIIKGEAGCGKSHLLGDVADQRIREQQPTILLLGQHFKGSQNVFENIRSQLGLTCSNADLLNSLNNIGKQVNSRVLILIDALNEGAGKELWYNELAGFINEITRYPYIGLALSVRSTYYEDIVPTHVQTDDNVTKITHEGFKGNEYAAIRMFCEHYELEQPHFPILAPEFTNPLFLQLTCKGLEASGIKSFPKGFQGINSIFSSYIESVKKTLGKKDEYRNRTHLFREAINEIAKACYKEEYRTIPLKKAIELFDSKYPNFRNLLTDLIQEGVFIKDVQQRYNSLEREEVIDFAYQRLGDFLITTTLLEKYSNQERLVTAFEKENELGGLVKDNLWHSRGLIEMFSIILPERFQVEIFEVYEWVFKNMKNTKLFYIQDSLNYALLDSLKWRTIESIKDDKLIDWFKSDRFTIRDRYNEYLYRLVELSAIPKHPFNSDRLHKILSSCKMSDRDAFWLQHIRGYSGYDDNEIAHPIRRMIDWAWLPEISNNVDDETARLAVQTLAWILSSPLRTLRDETTKAIVNLSQDRPNALISILQSFKDVDDPYIIERLYATAYGCALRTSTNDSLKKIAQFVYDSVFSAGNPPNHILLRDYARNTIEYALYKNLPIEIDASLIRPPYRSKMPDEMPTKDDVAKYKMDYNHVDYKNKYGSENNAIHHSVMESDFGRYKVDSALNNFNVVSFTMEKEYKSFLKELTKDQRFYLKAIEKGYGVMNMSEQKKNNTIRNLGREQFESTMAILLEGYTKLHEKLETLLDENQKEYYKKRVIPHFDNKLRAEEWNRYSFDTIPIRSWIVKRVFELGYDSQKHGSYDSSNGYGNRHENKIERIGKKYQWIAFHEILAMVADNYMLKEGWSSNARYHPYDGAWQLYLRDIDPAFITKNKEEEDIIDDLGITKLPSQWWLEMNYTYWNQANSIWVKSTNDLPELKQIIQRSDNLKNEWLYLSVHINCQEPKPIGQDKYQTLLKDFWYGINGYLVKKRDKAKIVKYLKKEGFWGDMPETSSTIGLINRELYWSPISKEYNKSKKLWQTIGDSKYKVINSIEEAVGEMSDDKSNAHFRYNMPCALLFEGMKLEYALNDGDFKIANGEVIVTNANPKGILIKKKDLLKFLSENDLEIIWTVLCEKHVYGDFHCQEERHYSKFEGVYYFENDLLTGELSLIETDNYI